MALSTPLPSSWANMLPIVESDVEMYNFMLLFHIGGSNTGGFNKYSLMSLNAR